MFFLYIILRFFHHWINLIYNVPSIYLISPPHTACEGFESCPATVRCGVGAGGEGINLLR